jgi:hypothetical protein
MTPLMAIDEAAQAWRLPLIVLMYELGYGVLRPVSAAAMADLFPGTHAGTILRSVFLWAKRHHPYQRWSVDGSSEKDRHGASMRLESTKGGV